jgi:myo-inositol 2-dehydrogenase / D-chiro-inositol 1-dehydrogenase
MQQLRALKVESQSNSDFERVFVMEQVLNVGIAGLGRLGKRHAMQLARHTPGARLLAACSPLAGELAWARDELGVARCHDSLDAMLADPDIQAVVLVTPTTLHADQTIASLRAGKHVFVEKPLSLDVPTCEAVEAVAREHPNQVAMVGYVRRFDPSYVEAKAAIDNGHLGRVYLVRSQTCDQNDPDGFFVRFAPTSGGIFMDCSVHDIDLARWFLGNPKATRVLAMHFAWKWMRLLPRAGASAPCRSRYRTPPRLLALGRH